MAVCLNCGEMKTGAFSTCPSCKHHPVTLDDRAAHYICSSQCNAPADLQAMAQKVKRKEKLPFNPQDLAMIKTQLAAMQEMMMKQKKPG